MKICRAPQSAFNWDDQLALTLSQRTIKLNQIITTYNLRLRAPRLSVKSWYIYAWTHTTSVPQARTDLRYKALIRFFSQTLALLVAGLSVRQADTADICKADMLGLIATALWMTQAVPKQTKSTNKLDVWLEHILAGHASGNYLCFHRPLTCDLNRLSVTTNRKLRHRLTDWFERNIKPLKSF